MQDILIFGDIVGDCAQKVLLRYVKEQDTSQNIIIANAENASEGFGLTELDYKRLISGGIDCLTGGNHIWDKKDIRTYISQASRLVRPYNMPHGTIGSGFQIFEKNNLRIGVISLLGRIFMHQLVDCPFRAADKAIAEMRQTNVDIIIVDMHAEATAEKISLARYLDGRVDIVVGTHTHVQTSDEQILPKGTAYITDMGACCFVDSVLGMSVETSLQRMLSCMPVRLTIPKKGEVYVHGVSVKYDKNTRKVTEIKRIKQIFDA